MVTFRNVNAEAAEKKVNAQLDANVDGDAFTDWERVAFFNTQIDPNNPLIHPDSTEFNKDANDQRFSEGYKEYFMENFVPKRIALNTRRLSQKELDTRAGIGEETKTTAPKERASTVVDLLSESPEQAISTYLGEIEYTRDGSKITITRDKGEETWDLIPIEVNHTHTTGKTARKK